MILLAGKIPSSKGWQGLNEMGRAEAPRAEELASSMSKLVLSGQAVDVREVFGTKGCSKGVETSQGCTSEVNPGYVWGKGMLHPCYRWGGQEITLFPSKRIPHNLFPHATNAGGYLPSSEPK